MTLRSTLRTPLLLFSICWTINLIAGPATAAGTAGTLSIASATYGVVQNLGVKAIAVNRIGGSTGAATVLCKTFNDTATAGDQYTALSETLQWANGDASTKYCSVTISTSVPFTGIKTFYVAISDATGATLGTLLMTTVTIYGNYGGGKVSLSAPTYSLAQSATSATVTVNRTNGAAGAAIVWYATANGTAIAGTNYTKAIGTLYWENNDSAPKSFTIPITKVAPFAGTRTIAVALAGPENVVLGSTSSAIVTLNGTEITISGAPATNVDAGSTYRFTPTVSNPSGATLTFSIQNKPSWASFNTATGEISGVPTASNEGYDGNIVVAVGNGTTSAALTAFGITVASIPVAAGASCTGTSGTLTLKASAVRATGIAPFLVFYDATASSDSAVATSVTQDVSFSWKFGDSGASGSGTWGYGSNAAANSMNAGNGIVAAHLYRTAGSDANYTATVTATDGTNTASCNIGVTAYDPGGSNGFAGNATTCISASGTPVAGSGGCPAGANVLRTSSIQTALSSAYGNGKRLLFKCGDSFSGNTTSDNLTAVKWAIGAYGGCQDTQSNRPIFANSGPDYIFQFSGSNGEGTLSDFNCEGNNSSSGGCIWADTAGVMYQDTIYNVYSNAESVNFNWAQCSQCGVVQVVQSGMGPGHTQIGSYFNFSGFAGYPFSGNTFNNNDYQAVIGSHFDGGATYYSSNAETVRISACAYCYVADNDFLNAGPYYAVLKLHEGNAPSSTGQWIGQYTEYVEISDNFFGGTSGSNFVEVEPQNNTSDERLRYIVVERNVAAPSVDTSGSCVGLSAQYSTLRDNVCKMGASQAYGFQVAQRGIEPAPNTVEIYNNSVYYPGGGSGPLSLIQIGAGDGPDAPSNTFAKNNLGYALGGGSYPMVSNKGTGSTVSNNTANYAENPSFSNASGTMKNITDWQPAANYSGATSVPVYYDALGVAWPPTWVLGATHH